MKALYSAWFKRFLFFCAFALLLSISAFSQQYLTKINGWNAYVHLPDDYNSTTQTYPVIIFVPGIGEIGTNPSGLLKYGPSHFIDIGVNMNQFTVNSQVVKPIIVSIQPPSSYPGPTLMNTMFDSISARFRVDPARFYGTGLSMGGFSFDNYITYSAQYAIRPTALVMMSAVVPNYPFTNFQWFAKNGGKWWGFQGDKDGSRQMPAIADTINAYAPGSAKITIYSGGHCCWNDFYDPNYRENGLNIYEWLLSQVRTGGTTPPPNIPPTARAGNDVVITLPTKSTQLDGSGSSDPDGTIIYTWSKVSGPASYKFSDNSTALTTVSNLSQGIYQFELKVTDNAGAISRDTVDVTVNAAIGGSPPIAPKSNAGTDQTITSPANSVTLTGTATGNIVSYNWQELSGPSQYTIVSPTAPTTVVNNLVQGSYLFTLTVTDNTGATSKDTVAVTLKASGVSSCGCDITISPNPADGSVYLDGNTLGVKPGNKICITAAKYNHIILMNFNGTATQPLTIVNCGGPVLITGNVSYGFNIEGSRYFHLTGTGDPATNYGFKVDNTAAPSQTGLAIGKNSSDFEVDHFEITGVNAGIFMTRVPDCDPTSWASNFTIQNVSYHDNYIHDTNNEGMYLGNTSMTYTFTCNGVSVTQQPEHINNMKVYNNILERTGWDGIQCSVTPVGLEVHDNVIRNFGTKNLTTQQSGIIVGGSSTGKVYNNLLDGGTGGGILVVGVGTVQIYNNVIANVGYDGTASGQDGILIDDRPNPNVYPALRVEVTNNTIVSPKHKGVVMYDDYGTVGSNSLFYNNIIVNPGFGAYFDITPQVTSQQLTNLLKPSVAAAKFVNAANKDYHLQSGSPAVDAGTNTASLGVVTDFDGNARPMGAAYDIGAFEYAGGPPPPNKPPVANAGADQTITLPTNTVTLTGSGSDSDGTVVGYLWAKISGPSQFAIVNTGSATTAVNNLAQGVYSFELTVTDNGGAIGKDTVVVTVNTAPNQPPVANAGADKTITLPTNTVTLSGSGTDPDGSVSSYSWTKISGPVQFNIASPTTGATTVNNLVQGVYQFVLTVTDNSGATGNDTVNVTVNPAPNQPPVAKAGVDQSITLPTDSVTVDGSASSDPDGTISTYLWTKIAGPGTFNISNPNSATTSITGLVQGSYQFRLTVTDNNGATAQDVMIVNVSSASNIPPVASAGTDQAISLPTNSVTLDASGSTDADGTISSYSWDQVSGPAQFAITNPTGVSTSVTGLVQGTYQFEVTVTDNGGASSQSVVTITVNAAPNQPPVANAGGDMSITLPSNSVTLNGTASSDPDGTIVSYSWTLISGPSQFNILNPTGSTTTVNNLATGTYQFQLTVTDNDGAVSQDIVVVGVNPAPNQPPVANAGGDMTITLPSNSVTLNGTGSSDPDGTIVSYSWTMISGPSSYTIVSPSAATSVVNNLVLGTYQFQLTVTDNAGATSTSVVHVGVNPAANKPPIADAGTYMTVIAPANATLNGTSSNDPDGTITSYSWVKISGPGALTILYSNTATAEILGPAPGTYVLQLTVTDNSGASASAQVTVTVIDASGTNQPPVAVAADTVAVAAPATLAALDGSASYDPDGSIVSYSWSQITGPGPANILTPNGPTTIVGALSPGTYVFELDVTDNKDAVSKKTVYVIVGGGANKANLPIVTIYPNPVRTSMTLKLDGSAEGRSSIIIYDVQGRMLMHEEFIKNNSLFDHTVDVSGLPGGTYFIEIKVDVQDKVVKKFIKLN